jgi:hypothetical protein
MQEQNTDPKPARQDLLDTWAAYEAAWTAAEAGGWEYDLSMAAANAYAAYDKLNRRIAQKGVKP